MNDDGKETKYDDVVLLVDENESKPADEQTSKPNIYKNEDINTESKNPIKEGK